MSLFDRFASWTSTKVSRATFFTFCVLIVVVWAPSYFVFGSLDTWQLVINTVTTVLTFLLVALLQNSQERFEKAQYHKTDELSRALVALMRAHAADISFEPIDPTNEATILRSYANRLEHSIGIQDEVSA